MNECEGSLRGIGRISGLIVDNAAWVYVKVIFLWKKKDRSWDKKERKG